MTEQNKKLVIAPGTKMFLVGLAAGLIIDLVLDLSLKFWFIMGVVVCVFFGIACMFHPRVQRLVYVFIGFFLGIAISYSIVSSFFDWPKLKI